MERTISKHMEPPWELKWQYHLPIFSWLKLKQSETMPKEWRRYIDDIFSLWDSDKKDVDQFIEQANKFHPTTDQIHGRNIRERDYLPRHSGVQRRKIQKWIHFGHQNSLQTYWNLSIVHISTHAIHPVLKMVSLNSPAKQWDCLELTLQKQHHLRRALWNSNNAWGHAAILKQSYKGLSQGSTLLLDHRL